MINYRILGTCSSDVGLDQLKNKIEKPMYAFDKLLYCNIIWLACYCRDIDWQKAVEILI